MCRASLGRCRIIKTKSSGSFARNTAVLSGGTAVAQLIGILVTPILSRIFAPADYGLLALYGAIVSIGATLFSFRYEVLVLVSDTDFEAKNIIVLVVMLAIAVGGLFGIVTLTMPEYLREWLGLSKLGLWLTAAVFASIATAIIGVISNWFNRRAEYKKLAILRVAQAMIAASCGLIFGMLPIRDGLIFAQSLSLGIYLVLFLYVGSHCLDHKFSLQTMFATARNNYRAPAFLLPTALLDVLTTQLPFILIAIWFSSEATGQYRMAYMLLGLPGGLIGAAVAQVFIQRFALAWPNVAAAKVLLIKTWRTLAIFGVIPLAIIIFFGQSIFRVALGESWGEAGLLAQLMIPMFFVSIIHSPTASTFVVMGLEKKLLYFGLAVLVYRPLSLYVGYFYNSLYLGLGLFVTLEIIQMLAFQYIAIKNLNNSQHINKIT